MKNLVTLLSLMMISIACSTSAVLRNLDYNNAVPGNLNKETVKVTIVKAGAQRGWVISDKKGAKDTLVGQLHVRKHYVEVEIPYTKESYKIIYVRSENMDYNPARGTIHRSYNRWVMNLKSDIDSALAVANAIK